MMHRRAEALKDFAAEKRGVAIGPGFPNQRASLSVALLVRLAQLAPSPDGDKQSALLRDVIGASAVFLVIALWKAPGIFRHPRFWAEEGTVFYAGFLGRSFIECIFYIGHGSFQILSNGIVYLAAQVPVAFAPAVTTYLALSLHLVIVAQIVLFARAHGLPRPVALLLVVASALLPQTYEVWLNSINAQWVAGVSALLLFAMPSEWLARHRNGALTGCLIYALSGVPAVLFAPVFLLRAAVERSRLIAALAGVLGTGAALQLAVIAWIGDSRPFTTDPLVLILPVFLQSVLAPLLSGDFAGQIALLIREAAAPDSTVAILDTLAMGIGIMGLATAAACSSGRKTHALLLLLAWILITEVQNFAAVDPSADLAGWLGGRYFLCGSVCLCLLLAWGTTARQTALRAMSISLLCMIVFIGAVEARLSAYAQELTHGPSWRRQLDACQSGQLCKLTVWGRGAPWIVEIRK
jgi:hypothetical protein